MLLLPTEPTKGDPPGEPPGSQGDARADVRPGRHRSITEPRARHGIQNLPTTNQPPGAMVPRCTQSPTVADDLNHVGYTLAVPKSAELQIFVCTRGVTDTPCSLDMAPGDVLYTCLPLYHTAGGGLGAMSCFMSGAPRGGSSWRLAVGR